MRNAGGYLNEYEFGVCSVFVGVVVARHGPIVEVTLGLAVLLVGDYKSLIFNF